MTSVEDEIVAMKFDNTQFEKAVGESLSTLDKLKQALIFPAQEMGKGLSGIANSVKGFNLNPLSESAGEVGRAFDAMSVVAISAIATVASQATSAAVGLVKSLTIDQVSSGYGEYETKLVSIQTILANTASQGTDLDDVSAALDRLNTYADKTIYSFGDMVSSVKTFTTAGVDLDTSVASIKGLSNVTAIMGVSAQDASRGMFQLSQALASGNVRLVDWMSVEKAGFGGKLFQDSLLETARIHGIAVDDMIAKDGSFRNTLQEGWLTSNILTETLSKFTGDLSDAQLKSMGYTKKQIKDIQTLAATAVSAAQDVKGVKALFSTMREAVGSGWSSTFEIIFGNIEQSKKTFTRANDYFSGFITASADARNKVLAHWKELGGRSALIKAFQHAWEALMSILKPIHDAFRDIFPKATGKQLFHITQAVNQFFKHLILGKSAMKDLHDTFAGIFAVIHIFWSILKGVIKYLFDFVGIMGKGGKGVLSFTGSIGKVLVGLDKWISKGDKIGKFFDGLIAARRAVLEPIVKVIGAILHAFGKLITGGPEAFVKALGHVGNVVAKVWSGFIDQVSDVADSIGRALGGIGGGFGDGLSTAKGGMMAAIGGILSIFDPLIEKITGVKDLFANMFGGVASTGAGIAGGIGDAAKSLGNVEATTLRIRIAWDAVTHAFSATGGALGTIIKTIGKVFGFLGQKIYEFADNLSFQDILSLINTGLLTWFFFNVGEIVKNIKKFTGKVDALLSQVTSNLKTMQNEVRSEMIKNIAEALIMLALAVVIMSSVKPKKLGIALGALTAMMLGIVGVMKLMNKTDKEGKDVISMKTAAKMAVLGAAIVAIAAGMLAMSAAVAIFGHMDTDTIIKGLLSVLGVMTIMVASSAALAYTGGVGALALIGVAAAMFIISPALVLLAGAIQVFSLIKPGSFSSGIIKIGGALLVLGQGLAWMIASLPGAVALRVASVALIIFAGALVLMSKVKHSVKAIAVLGASLITLAIGLTAMVAALPGAIALTVAAAALVILTPALAALGALPWTIIWHGLGYLLLIFGALGLAAVVLGPVAPIIVILSGALLMLGAALGLAGWGMGLFAGGLAVLAVSGAAGFAVLIAGIVAFTEILPEIAEQIGLSMVAWAKVIGENAPELVKAFYQLFAAFLDQVPIIAPKVAKALIVLIHMGLKVIRETGPDFIQTGIDLIIDLLKGIENNADRIAEQAVNTAKAIVEAIGKQLLRLVPGSAKDFIKHLASSIVDKVGYFWEDFKAGAEAIGVMIIISLKTYIEDNLYKIWEAIKNKAKDWGGALLDIVKPKGGDIPLQGPYIHLVGGTDEVKSALTAIGDEVKAGLDKSKKDIDKWTEKLNKLKHAKNKDPKAIAEANKELNKAKKDHDAALAEEKRYKNQLKKHRDEILADAQRWDAARAKADAAIDAYNKAVQTQVDFKAKVMDTFATVPDIQAGESLASYMKELAKQQAKIEKFKTTLYALQGAGLDASYIQQFLDEGVDAQHVMDQLLAGGPEAVTQFENASAGLQSAGQSLADLASTMLGQDAAIQAAQTLMDGLVTGLSDPESLANIETAMAKIAHAMMKAIKKELDVKSPSRKMRLVGKLTVMGLIGGVESMHKDVEKTSKELGDKVLDTLSATLSNLGSGGIIDVNPTITPVLDLSQLTKDANQISSLLAINPISAGVSFAMASDISAAQQAVVDAQVAATASEPKDISFQQVFNTPKTPNPVEVYRNTKNLLSLAKEALR